MKAEAFNILSLFLKWTLSVPGYNLIKNGSEFLNTDSYNTMYRESSIFKMGTPSLPGNDAWLATRSIVLSNAQQAWIDGVFRTYFLLPRFGPCY
jgi:hypothetical protein